MLSESQKQSRGHTLTEAFFYRMDQELIESLRSKMSREENISALQTVVGIRNPKVVEGLVDAGFDLSTVTAFIWAPLVFVAWADGKADQLEKKTILDALPNKGVPQEAISLLIAHEWFTNRPSEKLWQIWKEFSVELLESLNLDVREELTTEIVDLCFLVAQSSGGFLGIGKVSQSESIVIDRIIASLEPSTELSTAMLSEPQI